MSQDPGPVPPAPSTGTQIKNAGTAALTYSGAPAIAYYTVNTVNDLTYYFYHTHISANGMGLLWIVVTGALAYLYAHARGLEALLEQAERVYHVQQLNHTYVVGNVTEPVAPPPAPPVQPPVPPRRRPRCRARGPGTPRARGRLMQGSASPGGYLNRDDRR